ncbi:hypothetical protein L7F22_018811, partial [Adiantum nelumboides]|nr:hypothetical protein [Adiantum nelumboides]
FVMAFPQLLLDNLLSKPQDEALKMLDMWRASKSESQLNIIDVTSSEERKSTIEWFEDVEPIKDLQNNAKEKKRIENIIKENMGNSKPIILHGDPYHWEEMDIYNYCVKSLAAKWKWKRRKSSGSTSSTATSAVDGDLKENEINENHE